MATITTRYTTIHTHTHAHTHTHIYHVPYLPFRRALSSFQLKNVEPPSSVVLPPPQKNGGKNFHCALCYPSSSLSAITFFLLWVVDNDCRWTWRMPNKRGKKCPFNWPFTRKDNLYRSQIIQPNFAGGGKSSWRQYKIYQKISMDHLDLYAQRFFQ